MARTVARSGFHLYTYREFSTQIRGGYTSYELSMGPRPVMARSDDLDLLVALTRETVERSLADLTRDAVLIHDSSGFELPEELPSDIRVYPLPLRERAQEIGAAIVKNTIALGASAYLIGIPLENLKGSIMDTFKGKAEEVIGQNLTAADEGWNIAQKNMFVGLRSLGTIVERPKLLMSGDEAVSLGALTAGCRFFAGYPITPASPILEWLASHLPEFGGVVIQAEDEISALGYAVGAGYAGARSMTATSGPGLSLMVEMIGLAGMSETPVVIVDVQRVGPSTGLPTKHEQSDIDLVTHASHGDPNHVVLTAGTVQDCYHRTALAFNAAERYQCPVILLIDMALGIGKQTVDSLSAEHVEIDRGQLLQGGDVPGGFMRYRITDSGISSRFIPGTAEATLIASSVEHDETGLYSEDPENRVRMTEKRLRKMETIRREIAHLKVFGDDEAGVSLVGIGSVKGSLLHVLERMSEDGFNARYVDIPCLLPFPREEMNRIVASSDKVLVVEHNSTGQLFRYIRSHIEASGELKSITKFDGTPFRPNELYQLLREEI